MIKTLKQLHLLHIKVFCKNNQLTEIELPKTVLWGAVGTATKH